MSTAINVTQQAGPVRHLVEGLLDLLYPPRCLCCGAWIDTGCLCESCVQHIAPVCGTRCGGCGMLLAAGRRLCGECAAGINPGYGQVYPVGQYEGVLQVCVRLLKFHNKRALAVPLGRLVGESVMHGNAASPAATTGYDMVVPLPLHPRRKRERGYNQAELLAREVCMVTGVPVETQGLRRVQYTHAQTALTAVARAINLQHAFAINEPSMFGGKSVLLCDDVLTTAATAKSAARVLRAAGAIRVDVAVIALTPTL